jgi:hypothetical protein
VIKLMLDIDDNKKIMDLFDKENNGLIDIK